MATTIAVLIEGVSIILLCINGALLLYISQKQSYRLNRLERWIQVHGPMVDPSAVRYKG